MRDKSFLIISPRYPNQNGKGDQLVLYHRIKCLADHGASIKLIVFSAKSEPLPESLSNYINLEVLWIQHGPFQVLLSIVFTSVSLLPIELRLFQNIQLSKRIKNILRKNPHYIILFFTLRSWQYIVFPPPTNYFLDLIDSYALNYSRRKTPLFLLPFNLLQSRLYMYTERMLARSSRASFVVSHIDQNFVDIPQISVISNGVLIPTETIHPMSLSSPAGSTSLGFIGNLSYRPNKVSIKRFATNVFSKVLLRNNSTILYIAGNNCKGLHLSQFQNIKMLGRVKCQFEFLAAVDIVIVPMYEGSGMQNKLLEAMALGKSIVTTNIAAEPLKLKNYKHALIASTDDELAEYVLLLIEDFKLRSFLGFNAKKLSEQKYTWDKSYDKLISHMS